MRDVITIEISVVGETLSVEMHPDPHLEEIAALVAIEEYGNHDFLSKYCMAGKLRLGVESGPFDEHPDAETGESRKKGCCLTLVAEALDLLKKAPWWRQMVAFCNFAETGKQLVDKKREATEARHPFDLYSLARLLFRWRRHLSNNGGGAFTDEMQQKVIDHLKNLVRMFVWDQEVFHAAYRLIRERGLRSTIEGPGGKQLSLVVVEVPEIAGHNWHIGNAARAWFKADVVVQKDATGHVHIFTNNKAGLNLDDLAQALNVAEQEAEGNVCQDSWAELRKEGRPYDGGRWFYARPYGQLHNGTEHFADFQLTLLPLDGIVGLVKMSLDTGLFDPRKADDCRKGVCRHNGCSLYKYGLQRCRKVRYEQKQEQEKKGR